ncbi:MAG: prepilin-type N-terminal cleavage/methylation domain-containing protein [Myxococcota bacterium]
MRRHPRGFTLLEIMMVVAIVAIGGSIVAMNISTAKGRQSIHSESERFRQAVDRARSLSAVLGSRLSTARIALGNCVAPALPDDQFLPWIQVNTGLGTALVPSGMTYNAATDITTLNCDTFTFGTPSATDVNYAGTISVSPAIQFFAFDANGRLVTDGMQANNGARPFQFKVKDGADTAGMQGFFVMNSGITCSSKSDASPLPANPCDMN